MIVVYGRNWRRKLWLRRWLGEIKGCGCFSNLKKVLVHVHGDVCILSEAGCLTMGEIKALSSVCFSPVLVFLMDELEDAPVEEIGSFTVHHSSWSSLGHDRFFRAFCLQTMGRAPVEQSPWLLLGDSPLMQRVREQIELVSGTSFGLPVLIQGESGTGKEICAHMIHAGRYGLDKPLVPVACSEFLEHLGPSLLFGVEKGAYTGSVATEGLLSQADGTTLFLDELETLLGSMQAQLLRFLDTGSYHKVGSTRTLYSRPFLISATNVPLDKLVADHRFRSDLYWRLSGYVINLPPLRSHKEDIPLLCRHYLVDRCHEKRSLSSRALDILSSYDWPGNVRELFSVLRRSLLASSHMDHLVLDPDFVGSLKQRTYWFSTDYGSRLVAEGPSPYLPKGTFHQ